MRTCFWNKALAWKEWRQNKSKFWAIGVILMSTPIIGTTFFFIFKAVSKHFGYINLNSVNSATAWSEGIAAMMRFPGNSSTGMFAVLAALGLERWLLLRSVLKIPGVPCYHPGEQKGDRCHQILVGIGAFWDYGCQFPVHRRFGAFSAGRIHILEALTWFILRPRSCSLYSGWDFWWQW